MVAHPMAWEKIGKGLQASYHPTRKYGKARDRYIRGRYMVAGKLRIIGFGWESEFAKDQKAKMHAQGKTGRRAPCVRIVVA